MTAKEIDEAYDLEQRFRALIKEAQEKGIPIIGKIEKYHDVYYFEYYEKYNEFYIGGCCK